VVLVEPVELLVAVAVEAILQGLHQLQLQVVREQHLLIQEVLSPMALVVRVVLTKVQEATSLELLDLQTPEMVVAVHLQRATVVK
jgi:hypothetical protein